MPKPLFDWLTERGAGILLHPTSLPGPYGIGTFGRQACRFIDFLAAARITYWQVCPLGPTGYGDSPYQCFSAFAGNPYFIDLDLLVEEGWLQAPDLDGLRGLSSDRVDYGAQFVLRWPILRKAYRAFSSNASAEQRDDFENFQKKNRAWLDPYARFVALKDKFAGEGWQRWPVEYRHFVSAKRLASRRDLGEPYAEQVWYQYQFFKEWRALREYANARGVRIFGDIPIFVAMDSADVWAHPDLFLLDKELHPTAIAGVPPDYFAVNGQLWGNPLYDWKRHATKHFKWWLDRLAASFALYDIVRVDHFRGFDEYCRIPPDALDARDYTWEPGPGLKLFEAISAVFPDAKLVAEDLGLITDSVRQLVTDTVIPGMKILQFAFEGTPEYLPHRTQFNCVLYPGTHDNDTAWGWFRKQPDKVQHFFRSYLNARGDAIPWDMIRAGYASASRLFVVPAQDLLSLGSESRMNTPGTAAGNWQWRINDQQMRDLEANASYLASLADLYER